MKKTKRAPVARKPQPVSRAALSGEADPRLVRMSVSIHEDAALFAQDVRGSQAHVAMLAAQGIVPLAAAGKIRRGLDQVRREFEQGLVEFDSRLEDVHTAAMRRAFPARLDRAALGPKLKLRPDQAIILAQSVGYPKP